MAEIETEIYGENTENTENREDERKEEESGEEAEYLELDPFLYGLIVDEFNGEKDEFGRCPLR